MGAFGWFGALSSLSLPSLSPGPAMSLSQVTLREPQQEGFLVASLSSRAPKGPSCVRLQGVWARTA